MSDEIDKLNNELVELFKNHYEAEELFNLGVGFGKFLEKNKLEDVRLDFFIQHDIKKEARITIKEEISKLNNSLLKLVQMAFKEEIDLSNFGYWEIRTSSFSGHKHELSEEVYKKYNFQIDSVSQPSKGGDFDLRLRMTGKLADTVKEYGLSNYFSVSYSSGSGEEDEYIREDEIESIYGAHLHFNIDADSKAIDKVAKCVHALSKEILLLIIKNS